MSHSPPSPSSPSKPVASAKVQVSPAHLRSLMPNWPDRDDELFRKHQSALYRLMELNARQNKFETHYVVSDAEVADAALLDRVHARLMRWLSNPRDASLAFHLKPSSKAPRSFVVSWDPVETPRSVTTAESSNKESTASRRLRSFTRSTSASDQRVADVYRMQQQRRRDQLLHTPAVNNSNNNAAHVMQPQAPPAILYAPEGSTTSWPYPPHPAWTTDQAGRAHQPPPSPFPWSTTVRGDTPMPAGDFGFPLTPADAAFAAQYHQSHSPHAVVAPHRFATARADFFATPPPPPPIASRRARDTAARAAAVAGAPVDVAAHRSIDTANAGTPPRSPNADELTTTSSDCSKSSNNNASNVGVNDDGEALSDGVGGEIER